MSFSTRMLIEPLRTLPFGSIGGAYMGIGTALNSKAHMAHIVNLTDAKMMFSFDGVNDYFILPVYGFLLLDVCLNRATSNFFAIAEGERLYVKQIDIPTTGNVYVTVFYGKDE